MRTINQSKRFNKKNVIIVLVFIMAALFCINNTSKANSESFAWMDERISADLKAFDQISIRELNALEQALRKNNFPYMRLKIRNGNLDYTAPEMQPQYLKRVQGYMHYLKKIQSSHPLPNTELVIVLDDGIDEKALANVNAPVFCGAKSKSQTKILVLPELFLYPKIYDKFATVVGYRDKFPWESKVPVGYWRGSTTGAWFTPENWMHPLRSKFVMFAESAPKMLDCAFSLFVQGTPEGETVMRNRGLFKEAVMPESQLKYKYLIAIDGNTCASSLKWQLFSNSVVLKNESEWMEWYDTALIPYKHYVPFKNDFSDLLEKLEWLKQNDETAKNIAKEARHFAQTNLARNGAETYVWKLFTAYSKRLIP